MKLSEQVPLHTFASRFPLLATRDERDDRQVEGRPLGFSDNCTTEGQS